MCDKSGPSMPFVYKPPVLAAAVLCFLAVTAASPASAGGQRPVGLDLIQIAARPMADGAPPPVVDGKVNDESWIGVEPYTNFIQTDPIEGAPASERTEVRVLFDKSTPVHRRHRVRLRARQDRRHPEPSRCRPHRVGRDHRRPRHVQRQPERVRLRHQSARHRIRRPGRRRRPDQRASRRTSPARADRSAAASARSTRTGTATGS